MPQYRAIWLTDTNQAKATRATTLSLAFAICEQQIAAGLTAKVQRQRPDGRWTSLGVPTPRTARRFAI
jgi:hypothetical protein